MELNELQKLEKELAELEQIEQTKRELESTIEFDEKLSSEFIVTPSEIEHKILEYFQNPKIIYQFTKECLSSSDMKQKLEKFTNTTNKIIKALNRYYKYRKFIPIVLMLAGYVIQTFILVNAGYLKSAREALHLSKFMKAASKALQSKRFTIRLTSLFAWIIFGIGLASGALLILNKISEKYDSKINLEYILFNADKLKF